MATQVYRVTRVQTAASSPVARLQALDEDGHEARLEVPAALTQRIAPGHVLVLHWSVHALPEPITTTTPDDGPPATTAVAPAESAASGRTVDETFMHLMSRVRRGTSATHEPLTPSTPSVTQTRGVPDIDDEFNTLLGPAQRKGSTNGR